MYNFNLSLKNFYLHNTEGLLIKYNYLSSKIILIINFLYY